MSHTTTIDNTVFIHDGDFIGDVEIRRGGTGIIVPFEDLLALVAEYVRMERIAKLEQMVPYELFDLR